MSRHRGRAMLVLLAIVTYNSWLLWRLNGDPRALSGYLSELAAQDQPYQWLFRLGDLLAAAVFAVIAVLGRRGWGRWIGPRAAQVSAALLVVAVGTVADAVFNLPCAESRDAVCAAAPSLVRRVHEASSTVVSISMLVLIGLVALGWWERERWSGRVRATAGLGVVVAALLFSSTVAPKLAPGTQGAVQIIQVVLCSAWIGLLAWRLEDEDEGQQVRDG
ncbi:MAG: DUF998 domain-containing protein [Actinomyces ruminicola]|nr:DUF998 domain-containing protein [Actinomyces ruminicola]MBE6482063.1 DUF998 domain-containing protein [Actinomyces ruminicola]